MKKLWIFGDYEDDGRFIGYYLQEEGPEDPFSYYTDGQSCIEGTEKKCERLLKIMSDYDTLQKQLGKINDGEVGRINEKGEISKEKRRTYRLYDDCKEWKKENEKLR